MATQKNARYAQKIDSLANWQKATSFVPMEGELFLVKDYVCPIVLGDGENSAATLATEPLFAPISNEAIDSLFKKGGVDP